MIRTQAMTPEALKSILNDLLSLLCSDRERNEELIRLFTLVSTELVDERERLASLRVQMIQKELVFNRKQLRLAKRILRKNEQLIQATREIVTLRKRIQEAEDSYGI